VIRYLFGKFWILFAVLTIVAAVLLTFVRLMLPYASLYQQEIQRWVGQALGQPVQIGRLEAEWHGLGPQLKLYDINFLDPNSGGVRASLKQAGLGIDVPASLLNAEVRFGSLTVSGVTLSVIRHADGSIAVAGLGSSGEMSEQSDSSSLMLAWLFSQERLALEDSTIHWYDEGLSQKDLQFVNVNLELRNAGERHQFDGSASLPNDLGRRFSFAADMTGDIFIAGGWGGRAYLNGAGLQTAPLLNWLPLAGLHIESGIAELRLWSEWQQSRLQQLDGELSIFGMNLSKKTLADQARGPAELLDALSGRFSWQRKVDGWHLDIDRFMLGRWGEFWPQGNYHLDWTRPQAAVAAAPGQVDAEIDAPLNAQHDDGAGAVAGSGPPGPASLQLWADYLRIDDVTALLMLTDMPQAGLYDLTQALQPSGELRQLHLQWHADDDKPVGHFTIDTQFSDVSVQPWQRFPGGSGLSGRVIANEQRGQLELAAHTLRFEAKPLFREALSLTTLDGELQWSIGADGWHWSGRDMLLSNVDIQLGLDIDVQIPADGTSPYLDLVAGFVTRPNALVNTRSYLPVGIMPKATVQWLDQALINGAIPNGGVVFHGPLKSFPFDRTDGLFEVRFVVEGGILDYAPDWPRLEELEAELMFSGRSMAINAVAGKILNADLEAVHAGIEDMTAKPVAMLRLNGELGADTAEVLRFLQLSPLRKRFGQFVEGVKARGYSRVMLDLQVPLAKGQEVAVNGSVRLQDSELLLAGEAVDLRRLNGELGFSAAGLAADDIQGQVMGLDAHFSVVTDNLDDGTVTTILASGNATIDEVRTIVDPPLFEKFSGRSEWQARLRVPGQDGDGSFLQISSDLLGIASNLPVPVAKPIDQSMPTVVEMHLPVELDRPVTVTVGSDIDVILDLDEKLQMQRGEIRFSDGRAQLPDSIGMRVAGIVPAFSFSEWLPLFEEAGETPDNAEGSTAGVNQVSMTVADVELYRRHFSDARVDATLEGNAWRAEIDSQQARGSVQVPLDDVIPLILDMEHLYLGILEEDGAADVTDPRQLPPMRIQSNSFHYGDIDFGSLALTASRNPAGLHMTDLRLQSALMDIVARGDWLVANDEHFSSFNIAFNSSNVGKALSRLGYAGTVKGGTGVFNINARWPGEPLSFALARLDGNMRMSIENGHLLEVDPGVGRIFGLLSLQALPRRLILDFRDVFSKGFAFDRIAGDFEVKDGQAMTSNLVMKGPSARIRAEGRIGLADRDYDQRVTVVPDVAATVPMVTALTQGPGVGAVVLLLKKLLEPNIDKAATIRYSVTGSWDNPLIDRLPDEVQVQEKTK